MQRRIFITGGSRGIGRAIGRRFQEAGYELIVPTRQELDLSSINSFQEYFARNSRLEVDVLVNNAAENRIKIIKDLSLEEWHHMLTINLTVPFLLIQQVTPYMAKNNWGRIVNISTCYSFVSRRGRVGYSASKSGLNALTRTAALEYVDSGILVNAVCPGFVETDLTRHNNTPEQIEALKNQIPLKRLASAEEVADLVFFLGSEQNTYITGQAIIIDGGFLAQ